MEDFLSSIDDILTCVKCKKCVKSSNDVCKCSEGHVFHQECTEEKSECGQCNGLITRDGFIEKLLEILPWPCEFKIFGCSFLFKRQDKSDHESKCKFRFLSKTNENDPDLLIKVFKEGHEDILEWLLTEVKERNLDFDKEDETGKTLFQLACAQGMKKIVQVLMEIMDISQINKSSRTLLQNGQEVHLNGFQLAIINGHCQLVNEILWNGNFRKSMNVQNSNLSPFLLATFCHQPLEMFLTLINGPKCIELHPEDCKNSKSLLENICDTEKVPDIRIVAVMIGMKDYFKINEENLQNAFLICCQRSHLSVARSLLSSIHFSVVSSAFCIACESGNLKTIDFLLKNIQAPPEESFFQDGLLLACSRNQVKVVQFLVEYAKSRRICLKLKNHLGETPFHLTCLYGNEEVLQVILANHELFDLKDEMLDELPKLAESPYLFISTGLGAACCFGHGTILKSIMEFKIKNPDFNDIKFDISYLHNAIHQGHTEIVSLLSSSLNPFKIPWNKKVNGDSPIFLAVKRRKVEIVDLLLKNEYVNLSFKRKSVIKRSSDMYLDVTALEEACCLKHFDIIEVFLKNDKITQEELENVIMDGNERVVQCILKYPDLSVDFTSCLFPAVKSQNPETIKLIISNPKVDCNFRNANFETCFHYVCQNGFDEEIIKMFLEQVEVQRVDLNAEDENELTGLDYCLFSSQFDTAKLIFEAALTRKNIDIKTRTKEVSKCCFRKVMESNHEDIGILMIQSGYINPKDIAESVKVKRPGVMSYDIYLTNGKRMKLDTKCIFKPSME